MALNTKAKGLSQMFEDASTYAHSHKSEIWDRAVKYIHGDQYIKGSASKDQNSYVANFIYKDYNTVMSLLTRRQPSLKYEAAIEDPALTEEARTRTRIASQVFQHNEFLIRLQEMLSYGLPFGRGYFKVIWDPTRRRGLGGIRIDAKDRRNISVPPGIGSITYSPVIFERERIDKMTALRRFPKQKNDINELFKKQQAEVSEPFYTDEILEGIHRKGGDKAFIEVVEAWVVDERTLADMPKAIDGLKKSQEFDKLENDDDKDDFLARRGREKAFPRGRLVTFEPNSHHVLEDSPNKMPGFPYVEYRNIVIPSGAPGQELGMGEFDQAIQLQDWLSAHNNHMADLIENMGTKLLYDEQSGLDPWEMTNAVNGATPVRDVKGILPIPGDRIPGEAFAMSEKIKGMMDEIQGRSDIFQGDLPGDVRSGNAILQISELAETNMKTRTQALESCMRQLGFKLIDMGNQFYKNGIHYGGDIPLSDSPSYLFNVFVKAGVNLPASETAHKSMMLTLYGQGVINERILIRELQIDNTEEIEAQMGEEWAAMRQAREAQIQAAGGGGPNGADARQAAIGDVQSGVRSL